MLLHVYYSRKNASIIWQGLVLVGSFATSVSFLIPTILDTSFWTIWLQLLLLHYPDIRVQQTFHLSNSQKKNAPKRLTPYKLNYIIII